ncbi:MAG TPA: 3-ketoacyl-ACP reductase [Candidatus Nosocomiicoccus stercorigallinarum]|nr:3-ketoacyl-ACP reductase [Candidatus Nosocomiicoccus stercorigallinarum]
MEELKNKVALITGGGRGIGRAVALELAKNGVNVGLVARSVENLEKVQDELKEYDIDVAIATGDVSDLDSITKAVNDIQEKLGNIDILINNAGISKFGNFLELDPEEWTNIVDVNLKGVYYTTRAVLGQMIERETGDIINISSTAGQKGGPVTSAYSASKAGVIGLSESLMMEVRKHNIRVMTFTPSTVATDMSINDLKITDGDKDSVLQPEDFAELMIDALKLNRRVVLKEAGIWSNNPS